VSNDRVDVGTAVNVTYKLVRILIEHEFEAGRLSPQRLRQLASIVEERSLDSHDPRDVRAANLLPDVVEATILRAGLEATRGPTNSQ